MKYLGMHVRTIGDGPRWPYWACDVCQEGIQSSGRVLWDSSLDAKFDVSVVGCMGVCSDACEQAVRDDAPNITAFGSMPVAQFLVVLAIGTLNRKTVSDWLDQIALDAHVEDVQMPTATHAPMGGPS